MADSWATSAAAPPSAFGADLHLELSGPGLRAGLTDALREAVRTGRLAPGTRLPSSRSLAADLGIARNTVADSYAELVAEGWLTAQQGSGTRVARRAEPRRAAPAAPAHEADPAPSHVRPAAGLAEPRGVSPHAVAHRGPPRADRGAARRLRLRRRPRPGGAAHRARGLSGAGPRGVRRAGADRHLLRFPPRSDADGAGAAGRGGCGRWPSSRTASTSTATC